MKYRIAIVISQFNQEITSLMEENAMLRATDLNINPKIYKVPGVVEIPIIAKKLALKGEFDAIITLGAVIRGETTHYDYVCNQVSYGCQKIALEQNIPVIFGILTCENDEQAFDRINDKKSNKPKEMIDTAVTMIDLMKQIDAE
jgi:6,7-dimethyl-8-ribityllumazine synthase